MTTKDIKYYINSVDKAVTVKRTDSNFKRSSTMGRMSSNSIVYSREIYRERKNQLRAFFF